MSQVDHANVCSDPYRAALEDPGSVVRQMLADMVALFHVTHGCYPDRLCLTDGMTALLEAHYRREQVPLPGGKLINRDELFGCQLRFHSNRCLVYREGEYVGCRVSCSLNAGKTWFPAPAGVHVLHSVCLEGDPPLLPEGRMFIEHGQDRIVKKLYRSTLLYGKSVVTVHDQATALHHPVMDDPALGMPTADSFTRPTDGDEPITEEDERQHPYQDWQAIVRDGDTRLGYEDWVRHRKDEARHDAQMEAVAMAARRDAAVETRPETYRQIIVDVPKIDCDVMIKLPGGVDCIQVQLRPSNADTNYNGSLDVILPRDQAVTLWSGDSMQPSTAVEADPNTRIGKQIVTELPGDYS